MLNPFNQIAEWISIMESNRGWQLKRYALVILLTKYDSGELPITVYLL